MDMAWLHRAYITGPVSLKSAWKTLGSASILGQFWVRADPIQNQNQMLAGSVHYLPPGACVGVICPCDRDDRITRIRQPDYTK